MILQLPSPGVQHGQDAELSAEIFWIGSDILKCRGAFAQQSRIALLLIRAQPLPQSFGHSEGDEVVGNGQEFAFLVLDPLGCIGLAALGAGAVIAGVIDKMMTVAVGAAINLPAQSQGAAT